jgi:hypothetical protein
MCLFGIWIRSWRILRRSRRNSRLVRKLLFRIMLSLLALLVVEMNTCVR